MITLPKYYCNKYLSRRSDFDVKFLYDFNSFSHSLRIDFTANNYFRNSSTAVKLNALWTGFELFLITPGSYWSCFEEKVPTLRPLMQVTLRFLQLALFCGKKGGSNKISSLQYCAYLAYTYKFLAQLKSKSFTLG